MSDVIEHVLPKHKIGDKFYIAGTKRENRKHDCPDCLGEKVFKVTSPAGGEYTLECPRCGDRYGLRDVPSLRHSVYSPDVTECVISGYSVNEWAEKGVTYRSARGYTVPEGKVITDPEVAMMQAKLLAAKQNEEAEQKPEVMAIKHFAGIELKEAVSDQFKTGLYDAWASYRHMREVVDDLISEEQEHLSASDIRDSLRDVIECTHKYDFVFKGFTRAMETVVKLVSSDDVETPNILALLRQRWADLPEQAQGVWEPSFPKSKWLGDDVPTF